MVVSHFIVILVEEPEQYQCMTLMLQKEEDAAAFLARVQENEH